jgi:hypothetical protein
MKKRGRRLKGEKPADSTERSRKSRAKTAEAWKHMTKQEQGEARRRRSFKRMQQAVDKLKKAADDFRRVIKDKYPS